MSRRRSVLNTGFDDSYRERSEGSSYAESYGFEAGTPAAELVNAAYSKHYVRYGADYRLVPSTVDGRIIELWFGRDSYGDPNLKGVGILLEISEKLDISLDVRGLPREFKEALRGKGAETPVYEFEEEEGVLKVGGSYQAEGVIKARFPADDGTPRYVFRFKQPAGLLHIFHEKQLRKIEEV